MITTTLCCCHNVFATAWNAIADSVCITLQVDAKVLLGDRQLHITLARVWDALSSWEKMKLVWTLVHTGLNMPDKEELAEELEGMKVPYNSILTDSVSVC